MEFVRQSGLFEPPVQLSLFGEKKTRVIIEGGFQDDWSRLNSVHPMELDLGEDISRVNIRYKGGYQTNQLILLYSWIGAELVTIDPLKDRIVEYNINDYQVLQSVASLITEDGRVYFDLSLYSHWSESNRERLHIFKNRLAKRTDGTNSVNLFFTPQGKERFRGTAIEVYDTIPS